MLTYGSLFAGYGGLDMGVKSVIGGGLSWYAEFEKAPAAIMAHHHPSVPNLGDVTKVDWASVPKVDVITGGSPCQDLSHAGKRAGMTTGTRSNLWVEMREAIATIRPRLVVWENVRGAYSAPADSAVEHCPGCMGGAEHSGTPLRALGRVLGDLSDLGYDAWWVGLRAADVGACHGRFRVFVFAVPADSDLTGLEGLADQAGTPPAGRHRHAESGAGRPDLTLLPTPLRSDAGPRGGTTGYGLRDWSRSMPAPGLAVQLLPTPTTSEATGPGEHGAGGDNLRTVTALLPTPRATRGGSSSETRDLLLPTPRATDGTKGGPNQRGSSGDLMLPSAVGRLLPTPTVMDHKASGGGYNGQTNVTLTDATVRQAQDWREYEAAIRRHEAAFGRLAPLPTEPGAKGQPRLSPKFVEWMMGLPAGHVTDPAIGITRNEMLKALGNGVCPPQAAAATRWFLAQYAATRRGAA